jgi:hypothetical protein
MTITLGLRIAEGGVWVGRLVAHMVSFRLAFAGSSLNASSATALVIAYM